MSKTIYNLLQENKGDGMKLFDILFEYILNERKDVETETKSMPADLKERMEIAKYFFIRDNFDYHQANAFACYIGILINQSSDFTFEILTTAYEMLVEHYIRCKKKILMEAIEA